MLLRFAPSVAFAALVFGAPSVAQNDRIVFTDGSVVDSITVTDFNLRKIDWRGRGGAQSRSSDQVVDLEVEKVKDAYRRAYADAKTSEGPGNFLRRAGELERTPFLAQFGYVEAASLFRDNEQFAEAFACFDELEKKCPDSGFLPRLYQWKLDYYIARRQASDADKVAARYLTAAQTQGFPAGYAVEAEYYKTMAQAVSGTMSPTQIRDAMRLVDQKAAAYPTVSARARLQIANAAREGKDVDAAETEYRSLLERDNTSDEVRAGAWLGLGKVLFEKADPTSKQPYYDALLAFLRVYLETPDAAPEIVGESLYMASQAATKWGGPDSARMASRLRRILNRDFPENPFKNGAGR